MPIETFCYLSLSMNKALNQNIHYIWWSNRIRTRCVMYTVKRTTVHLKQVISCCYSDTEGTNLSSQRLMLHVSPIISTIKSNILQFYSGNSISYVPITPNGCFSRTLTFYVKVLDIINISRRLHRIPKLNRKCYSPFTYLSYFFNQCENISNVGYLLLFPKYCWIYWIIKEIPKEIPCYDAIIIHVAYYIILLSAHLGLLRYLKDFPIFFCRP